MFLSSGSSSPLFLTPYIEADKIEEAQAKSRVRLYGKKLYGAPIHSGLITVNAKLNSNVFFLLVKAEVSIRHDIENVKASYHRKMVRLLCLS